MLFSIVIPVYNVAEYLPGCVDSVLKNNCRDCEIILVDDGATDGVCPGLCDEYAARFPQLIRVIHQENRGLGGARNTGLEAARGEYLLFLDSDDTLVPGALAVLREAVAKTHADIISFQAHSDRGDGRLTPIRLHSTPHGSTFRLRERPDFLLSLPSAWSRLWKRRLFLDSGIRYPSRVWYEDIRTSLKLFALAGTIHTLDDSLYRYLQRPGSIMNSAGLSRSREILDAFDDLLAWFRTQGLYETYRDQLTRLAVDHVLLAATVRVARQDPAHPLLAEFPAYMAEHFPDYMACPLLSNLPWLHKLLLPLVRGRHYRIIRLLFRIKG